DLPDLKGKVIIVTGGNAGIGFATVQHLARLGAKVYLAARNEGRATAAISRLQAEGLGPGNDFMKSESRLDVLGECPRLKTCSLSVDCTFPHHSHIGPFVFTRTLLPLLIQTASQPGADVRIVNARSSSTSGGHIMIKDDIHFLTLDDLNKDFEDTFFPRIWIMTSNSTLAFPAYSKLANVLFTRELQKHVDAAGAPIIVTSVHPGFVGSETHIKFWESYHTGRFPRLVCTPPFEGAYNSVFAAVSPVVRSKPAEFKGAYLMPVGKIRSPVSPRRAIGWPKSYGIRQKGC
ncbi:hypothetical protein JAAARDRAFT_697219, partial [Jaapia argillacea MUCL 33604]